MIECKSEQEIVSFDGRIIERFHPNGAAEHYHIDYVESVEIVTKKKDRKYLKVNPKSTSGYIPFLPPYLAPEDVPQAQALVNEVQRVIGS